MCKDPRQKDIYLRCSRNSRRAGEVEVGGEQLGCDRVALI
jgi:hypothetical protein